MIHPREVLPDLLCLLSVLQLRSHRRIVRLTNRLNFRWPRPYAYPARPVVAHTVPAVVLDSLLVHVMNHSDVHVVHCAIVCKTFSIPTTAFIPISGVPVAVVDTAVVADMKAPESAMPPIPSANETPIARRP
jgi:hypothetical protein